MKKSVNTTKVNECSEICYILNSSFYCITNIEFREQLFLLLSTLCYKKLSSITDHTVSSRVELADYEFDFLSFILAEIFLIRIGNKACRDKYSYFINCCTNTAAKNLCNCSFQHFVVFICFAQSLISFFCSQSLICKKNLTLSVIYFQYLNCHCITYGYNCCKVKRLIVGIFALCDDTVCFISNVQDNLIRFHVDYCTFDNLSIVNCFK